MPPSDEIVILPSGDESIQPLFSEEEYEQFRHRYTEAVAAELERLAEARRKSEEEARQRLLR